MAINDRTISLELKLRQQLARVTDQQVRDLVKAWAQAWDEVAPDLEAALLDALKAGENVTITQLLRTQRLTKSLDSVARQLRLLADEAGVRITSDLRKVIDDAGRVQSQLISSQLPIPQDLVDLGAWSQVSDRAIAAIVKRSTEQIHKSTYTLSRTAEKSVRRELVRGVAAGSNPRVVARRMVERANGAFNGGLNRAMTLARTEMLDAHRQAARLGREQHSDVITGWQWLSTMSPRTCPACWSMHGTIHPPDEPGPYGHQCCQCTAVPLTKPWSELGFKDLVEPPSLMPDADQRFAGLSSIQQHQVLGTKGYTAWKAGKFPREKWAVRQKNPGWRDSFVPSRPPKVSASELPAVVRKELPTFPTPAKALGDVLKDVPKINAELLANMEKRGIDVGEWNRRATNPLFHTDRAYQVNCQRVVQAFELRSRGYDVTARLNPGDGSGNPTVFMQWLNGAERRRLEGGRYVVTKDTLDLVEQQAPDLAQTMITDPARYVTDTVESWPIGARGWVAFFRERGAGHIFNVERTAEGLKVWEAQLPNGGELKDLAHYMDQVGKTRRRNGTLQLQGHNVFVLRVDDLEFNQGVMEAITWS